MSYVSFIIEHNSINKFDECSKVLFIDNYIVRARDQKKKSNWRIGMAVVCVYDTDLSITGVSKYISWW